MTDRPIADPDTETCLGDGWHAVTAVDSDGHTSYWLLGHSNLPAGCCGPCCAPHEQHHGLPAHYRRRLNQCAATASTTGHRCRNWAPADQLYCHRHQAVS